MLSQNYQPENKRDGRKQGRGDKKEAEVAMKGRSFFWKGNPTCCTKILQSMQGRLQLIDNAMLFVHPSNTHQCRALFCMGQDIWCLHAMLHTDLWCLTYLHSKMRGGATVCYLPGKGYITFAGPEISKIGDDYKKSRAYRNVFEMQKP